MNILSNHNKLTLDILSSPNQNTQQAFSFCLTGVLLHSAPSTIIPIRIYYPIKSTISIGWYGNLGFIWEKCKILPGHDRKPFNFPQTISPIKNSDCFTWVLGDILKCWKHCTESSVRWIISTEISTEPLSQNPNSHWNVLYIILTTKLLSSLCERPIACKRVVTWLRL